MKALLLTVCLLVAAPAAEARLTFGQFQSLAGTSNGDLALASWFDGLAAGLGYSYRDARSRKVATQWCVPDDFEFSHQQLRTVIDKFIADSVKSRMSYPPETPMEAIVATALTVYYDCKKSRM